MSNPDPSAPLPPPPFAPPPTAQAGPEAPDEIAHGVTEPAQGRRRPAWVAPVMLVVVLVVIGVGLAVWAVLVNDDGESAADRPATLVRVDTDRDELLVHDDTGEELLATLDLSDGGAPAPTGDGRLYDATALENGELRVYDLAAGTMEEYRVQADAGWVTPLGDHLLVIGTSSTIGDLDVVDTATGDVDGLADSLDLETSWSLPTFDLDAGAMSAFAIDLDVPTRAVVPASGLDDAWTFEGSLLDLWAADLAVASTPSGDGTTELSFVGPGGVLGQPVELEGVAIAGVAISDGAAMVVDADGRLVRADAANGTLDDLADLDVGTVRQAFPIRDRLLVLGEEATVLVDPAGNVLGRWDADELDEPWIATIGTHCLSLLPADGVTEGGGILVDLATGDELVDLDGRPIGAAGDGCSFIVFGPEADQVVVNGDEVDLGVDRVDSVDPVGERVLVHDRDEETDEITYRLLDLEGAVVAELDDRIWLLVR